MSSESRAETRQNIREYREVAARSKGLKKRFIEKGTDYIEKINIEDEKNDKELQRLIDLGKKKYAGKRGVKAFIAMKLVKLMERLLRW